MQIRVSVALLMFAGCATAGCATAGHATVTDAAERTSLSPQQFAQAVLLSGLPWETSEREPGGGLLYDAYFNSVNAKLLREPVRTLRAYCEGKGGKLAERKSEQVSAKGLTAEPVPEDVEVALASASDAFGSFACEQDGRARWSLRVEPKALLPVGEAPNWKLRMYVRASELDAPPPTAPSMAVADAVALDESREAVVAAPEPPVRGQGTAREDDEACEADGAACASRDDACAAGQLASCTPAQRYRSALLPVPRGGASLALVVRACERGRVAACALAGAVAMRGEAPVAPDPELAARLLRHGCSRGNAASCAAWGGLLERGEGAERDLVVAQRSYATACRKGDAVSCNNAGAIVARAELPRRAAQASAKAAAGSRQRELKAAINWFLRGCAKGEPLACANVGAAYLEVGGYRVKAAVRYLRRACDAGDARSCRAAELTR